MSFGKSTSVFEDQLGSLWPLSFFVQGLHVDGLFLFCNFGWVWLFLVMIFKGHEAEAEVYDGNEHQDQAEGHETEAELYDGNHDQNQANVDESKAKFEDRDDSNPFGLDSDRPRVEFTEDAADGNYA